MQATAIMERDVVTVGRGASLADAARVMLTRGINSVPVLDEDGRVIGMVGIRDVLQVPSASQSTMPILKWARLEEKADLLAQTPVERVMARPVVSVGEEATVIDVAAIMANRGLHPIPVLRDGRLLGVVGRADVARVLLEMAGDQRNGTVVLTQP